MTTVKSVSKIQKSRCRALLLATASILTMGFASTVTTARAVDISFDIPGQALADALVAFSQQTKINVLASFRLVQGKRAPAVRGTMDTNDALTKLLAGSGLKASQTRDGVVTIQRDDQQFADATRKKNPINVIPPNAVITKPDPTTSVDEVKVPVEEVIITGSRIAREGYEAPTPLIVIGAEQFEKSADFNLITFLNTMPVIIGSATPASSGTSLSSGIAGLQTLNLRSLGANRLLVLLDGRRTVGSSYQGIIDIASFPRQLVSRVDVVTGGASAVYGSDAVAGVVNFILDKNFVGVKGELSGGLTNYGDDKNYKADVSAGFTFDDSYGHVLLSAEHMHSNGIRSDGGRQWNRTGFQQIVNPAYTPTNGLPQQLVQFNTGPATMTPGGIIVSGPLKGTAFGAGGTPFKYTYGSIYSNPFTVGGDWYMGDLRPQSDVDPNQTSDSFFARVSYDVTDSINFFVQYGWSQNHLWNDIATPWLLGGPTSPTIQIDNAFLPASVRAVMVANNISSFQLGTTNGDMIPIGNDNLRITNRINTGFEGAFNAFDSVWHLNTYFAYGASKLGVHSPDAILKTNYALAIDAVVNPATGQIVCRSTLTNPNNGCKPWNPLGIGVNNGNQAAFDWINNYGEASFQHGLVEQTTYAASATSEPLSLWAGPVSVAVSFEYRKDEVNAATDTPSLTGGHILGNLPALIGAQSVTEGALETVIPLVKNKSWAQAWDFTAAARFTGYNLSGFVATYKFGTTYTPIDDLTFRITRSRDVRAPNIQELFQPPSISSASPQIIDRFLAGSPQYPLGTTNNTGNPNLQPEKGDTTGVGVVLRPRFFDGFAASVDFWDVNINGAILPLNAQQVIDSCFTGQFPSVCSNITRNATSGLIQQIRLYSINLASQDVRGIDLEASYRTPASAIMSDWRGALSLHGNMTVYLRNYQNNTFNAPSNHVGENNSTNPPNWKMTTTAAYALDPLSIALTARAISSGTINSEYIQCTSGCPAATTDHPTINYNHIAGRFYLDANVTYKLDVGAAASGELFFSVKNMFSNDPPPVVTAYFQNAAETAVLYDLLGAVYRAGIRFRM